jgi:hypothetical protein
VGAGEHERAAEPLRHVGDYLCHRAREHQLLIVVRGGVRCDLGQGGAGIGLRRGIFATRRKRDDSHEGDHHDERHEGGPRT